jgi:hypothetical protein
MQEICHLTQRQPIDDLSRLSLSYAVLSASARLSRIWFRGFGDAFCHHVPLRVKTRALDTFSGSTHAELFELVPQRPKADAEQLRSRRFVLTGFGQCIFDGNPLDTFKIVVQ